MSKRLAGKSREFGRLWNTFAGMTDQIKHIVAGHLEVIRQLQEDTTLLQEVEKVVEVVTAAYRADRKVLFCGNGGSAADAQHLAAELSGRFYIDRAPLFAEALHVNTSFLTAVANDYSYGEAFGRLVEAFGRPGDVLFALSTSGNSPNIVQAVEAAGRAGLVTVGMTGQTGGRLLGLVDHCLRVPSADTPRIQEGHILLGHIICQFVEAALFGEK